MHRYAIGFITIPLCLLALVAHGLAGEKEVKPMSLALTSSAFAHNGTIPRAYTCDGKDISPPLAWTGIPSETKSLALILDDPDAPDPAAPKMTWVHWVLYNLPPSAAGLPEAVAPRDLPSGTREGLNEAYGLRRPLPADRPPSLLPQALCARCGVARPRQTDCGSTGKRNAGSYPRPGATNRDIPAQLDFSWRRGRIQLELKVYEDTAT